MMAANTNTSPRGLSVQELVSLADSLTVQEIRLLLALKQTAVVVPEIRAVQNPAVQNALHTCPHCGHTGPAERDFGPRIVNGEMHFQSWCRKCRSNPRRGNAQEL